MEGMGNSGNYKRFEWLNINSCERNYNELYKMVKDNFSLEEPTKKSLISIEDSKAIDKLKTTCQKVGGHYEVGLLWKKELQYLHEIYNNAYKCLMYSNKKY